MEAYTEETQESTQQCSESGYETQSQTESEPHFWGRLYPLKASLDAVDLILDKYTFGQGNDVDVALCREQIPEGVLKNCSKKHFYIERQQVNIMGAPATRVVLIDTSSNGTYINGHMLKKKKEGVLKKKILATNDVIGFPSVGKPARAYEAYVFVDALMPQSTTIPHSVRKKYHISFRLGAGTFGEVSLVFNKVSKRPFALKTITKDMHSTGAVLNSCKKKLLNELDILQTVNHPNVIKLMDVLDCKMEQFLILEYMEGKDLSHKIHDCQRLKEDTAKLYFYQISCGVEYLHSRGIIHRDLKPANILLATSSDETLVKLTDFGLSKVLSSFTMMKTLCGTKMYVAPEIVFGGGSFEYTKQVDIWSLGVILYVCLSGIEPFCSEPENIQELIKEAIYTVPSTIWDPVSKDAKSLIDRMLMEDPEERIKISEILNERWFQDDCNMLAKAHALCNDELSETITMSSFNSLENQSVVLNSSCDVTLSPPQKRLRGDYTLNTSTDTGTISASKW
ncbi:ovarian-specific serine/threonine-protein kinase Lok-like [Thrips palmi]|uniref:non-specific serine/threonine protein kinase n=1 Tax=Thrips palmi TaxID=161013 RepID=A0A6P8YX64_THRPL|nr:ovarian-specific serine/threonine-protein kinase Lok-like [Thrips palmi]